ncbi:hypothetical protein ACFLU6_08675 [Acidobacteriota bacterium]
MRFPGVFCLLLCTALSIFLSPFSFSNDWYIHKADAPRQSEWSMLRADRSGNLSIVYSGDRLYCATFDGMRWNHEIVHEEGCQYAYPSLSHDLSGFKGIAFLMKKTMHSNWTLMLARWDGVSWWVEVVDDSDEAGTSGQHGGGATTLLFDLWGNPVVSYYNGTADTVNVARWNGNAWIIDEVDSVGHNGTFASAALDAVGRLAVSYCDLNDTPPVLKFARFNGIDWHIEIIGSVSMVGGTTSLALDNNGNFGISYSDGALSFAYHDGTSWTTTPVNGGGRYSSLVFDAQGNPAISSAANVLLYSIRTGEIWRTEVADDSGDIGWPTSMVFEASGKPVICYSESFHWTYDLDVKELRLARGPGRFWDIEIINDTPTRVGRDFCLAVDHDDHPGVSYFDIHNGGLKYSHFNGSSWEAQTIESQGVGGNTSITFDSNGYAYISYEDYPNVDVKLARFIGFSWATELVDDAANNIAYTQVAVDNAGRPVICYYADHDLKVAWKNGASWTIAPIYHTPVIVNADGHPFSLSIDSSDRPVVSYCDWRDDTLKLARWNGFAWNIETIYANIDHPNSMALDESGHPVIAFQSEYKLILARWDGSAWFFETIIDNGINVDYISLDLDPQGYPGISYRHEDKGLKFARFTGSSWVIETVIDGADNRYTGGDTSLAFDSGGIPYIGFKSDCTGGVFVAAKAGPAMLYRGAVNDLSPGWKPPVLPLTSVTDTEISPFPILTSIPGNEQDDLVSTAPLILYRVLWQDERPAGTVLRAVKLPSSVDLHY